MKVFNVKILYAYKFIGQCLPIYAFYTILFIERGMAVSEVALLIALWSVFSIVFEVPSGILADRWNRRNMLAISSGLQGLCFVVWFFSHSFPLFALGFIFWGISGAFASGTEEGLIFDNLQSDGREEDFAEVYGKAQFFANAGTIVGIVSAGFIAHCISVGTMALLSAGICFVNAGIALRLREKNAYAERAENASGGFFATFRETGAFLKRSGAALAALLFLVFFASLSAYLDEFDALIIHDFHRDSVWVSVILAIRFIFVALGDLIAPKIRRRIPSSRPIILVNTLACVFLALFAAIWNEYALPLFGLSSLFMTVAEVLLVDVIQNEIREEGRATVLSLYGVGQNAVMVGFSLIYATLAGIFTLQQTYIILAAYGIVGGCGFYLLCKK